MKYLTTLALALTLSACGDSASQQNALSGTSFTQNPDWPSFIDGNWELSKIFCDFEGEESRISISAYSEKLELADGEGTLTITTPDCIGVETFAYEINSDGLFLNSDGRATCYDGEMNEVDSCKHQFFLNGQFNQIRCPGGYPFAHSQWTVSATESSAQTAREGASCFTEFSRISTSSE